MKMENTRILSGEVLVSKGALKINSSLPETGVKDVWPNGSWLEQKQTQAALEARKQLIELERIEKSGVLSHAEWRKDLRLAEVTQKVGSYWQYLGHNVGKCLYLHPEEALFLMEVNSLQLNYEEVKMSLQQAYALLLPNEQLLMLYKVYASLSRQGYRVYRYQPQVEATECKEKLNLIINSKKNGEEIIHIDENASKNYSESVNKVDYAIDVDSATQDTSSQDNWVKPDINLHNSKTFKYIEHGIQKLLKRKHKASKPNILKDAFENIPELSKNLVVNVMAPEERYLPGNIKLSKSAYLLNKEKILKRSTNSEETQPTPSASIEPMNIAHGAYVKRFRNLTPNFPRCNVWGDSINFRIGSQANHFRHFNFWRAPQNFGFFHLNMTFQRPYQYVPQFGTRLLWNRLLQPFLGPNNNGSVNNNNGSININSPQAQKRSRRQTKREHLNSIERLATYIKKTILESRVSDINVSRLKYLIQTYNTTYKTRLRVSDDFNVIVDENVIDTIDVDDEDEPTAKKIARDDNAEAFDDKLQRLIQLASQFKNLKDETTSRHKRMITKLIKTFNNSYETDYYLNNNFDVINRNDLTVISSSSDTETDDKVSAKPVSKRKLKNPFSILKQLSEKQTDESLPSTSKEVVACKPSYKYKNNLPQTFKDWLPDSEDFGRAEIISKKVAKEVIDIKKEEFLFDFMRLQPNKYESWYDLKISFLRSLKETSELFHCEAQNKTYLNSLVKQEDFTDTASVLKKLSIIKSNKTVSEDSNLMINFDVYNRDVQNFRKSNRPLPHFRVVCLKESSVLPSGADVAKLHSQYKDNVCVIFAVVGSGSISYLQINPVDLPIYISNNSNTA